MTNRVWRFNPQLPIVTSFLGLVTFTLMILLIQFPTKFQFSEILVIGTAVLGFFFIIGTMGGAIDQSNSKNINNTFRHLIQFCIGTGYLGLLLIIPALIYSFSVYGTIILIFIEVPIIIIFYKNFPDVDHHNTNIKETS